ncbi:hypothetical protein [Sphingomonas sp. FUKUSWIS1]|uniref:hypothetical protein n=1 Tax=Sphingomonas sp. FUKUSWIS1 TaxID=1379701 RepID=UPI001F20630D|nr:hypothetical protein [Sphingomonas sp. FUKUSWIS1]
MPLTSREVFRKSEMSILVSHQHGHFMVTQHRPPALDDLSGTLIFGFSWMLIMAIGLMPIAEVSLSRSPSITMPTTIAFL